MSTFNSRQFSSLFLALLSVALLGSVTAIFCNPALQADDVEMDEEAKEVVIERVAIILREAADYQIPLELQAVKSAEIRTPVAGTIAVAVAKAGQSIRAQAEVVRLDSKEQQIEFQRAQNLFKIAQLEEQAAEAGTAKEIAAARLQVARNDLDLAQSRLDRLTIQAPFDGHIYRVNATPGEYIPAGTTLAEIADVSQVYTEVPIERGSFKEGDDFDLQVEKAKVKGKIEAILPPPPAFKPLRDVFVSVAAARIVVDNPKGELQPGMAVFSPMVPRHPVVEVPHSALANGADGGRKVQVIREGFIRDLPVELMGAVGETHSFVSGRFAPGDELIIQASEPLQEGTWLRPRLEVLNNEPEAAAPRPRRVKP